MQAAAQAAPTPDVDAHRLPPGDASALRVDGLLDETAWRDAPVASGFRQQEPFEGEPATEITEVRVLFDDATLYVGVMARDLSPLAPPISLDSRLAKTAGPERKGRDGPEAEGEQGDRRS